MLLPLCHHHLSYPLNPLPDHHHHSSIHSSFSTIPNTLLSSNPKLSRPLLATCAFKSQTRPESAIKRIADKLRSLGYLEADEDHHQRPPSPPPHESHPEPDGSGSAGEIFVPLRSHLPKVRVGHTLDSSWSRPENPVPAPGSGTLMGRLYQLGNEVKRQMHTKQEKVEEGPTRAQEMLSPEEIRRLQRIGIGIKKKVKVGKAGITEGIVNGIHERWRRTELVRIACEDICRINMKRTHDILERKSGGLVIWRSGSNIILYRGPNYKYPYFLYNSLLKNGNSSGSVSIPHEEDGVQCEKEIFLSGPDGSDSVGPNLTESISRGSLIKGVGYPDRVRFQMPGEAELAEEADQLLDGLGPRFTDWWGSDPPPVDADLLPPVLPGYRRPFRLLPYGVNPKLTNDEMTTLKRLGRPIPCHFALGRNRKHQGLAASIIKLWERCEIAKIAVKRGFQNTNSELMAEELKQLTGGTLLSRDKYFIVLYRGKDFLPPAVSSAIEKRRKHGIDRKKRKEDRGSLLKRGTIDHASRAEQKLQATRVVICRTNAILSRALEKKAAAEKLISEIENRELPLQVDVDKEGITEEERYMLRKVGIRMKPFLLMGKRGVFSGTVENMHLHWKYRELVKVLCSEKNHRDALDVARTLEAESGGILVAVERVSKGYAIIVYRGKNYERPANLRPQTLLTKRQAMKRAIEAQRHQSLKLHVLKLTRNIEDLKQRLDKEMSMISSKKETKPQLVDAEEVNDKPKTENEKLDSELETEYHSHFIVPSYNEESGEVVEHDSVNIGDGVYASSDNLEIRQCDELEEFHCSENENELEDFNIGDGLHVSRYSRKMAQHDDLEELFCSESKNEPEESNVTEPQSSSVSVFEEHSNINIDVENGDLEPTSYPANFKPRGQANWSTSKNASGQLSGNEELGSLGYSVDISDGMNASIDGLEITQHDEREEFRCSENENDLKDFNISHGMHTSRDALEMAQHDEPEESFSSPTQGQANWSTSKNVSGQPSGNGKLEPLAEVDNELGPSTCEGIGNRPDGTTFKASKLSNRDRLLLRKQALKMRKRPVLAVGRSNVVSGVAKAIALHFERYPLAIVNVKARAKGTPIQELVFKLEQATGAVLVSQEINKVILYRGWGAGDESRRTSKAQHASKHSVWRRIEAPAMVSPELMDAIRAECGLQHKQKEEKTLGS